VLDRYVIELEPEVREWLDTLSLKDHAKVEAMANILADRAETLGEPYARLLGELIRVWGSRGRQDFDRETCRLLCELIPDRMRIGVR
jgi:hypothetical protein